MALKDMPVPPGKHREAFREGRVTYGPLPQVLLAGLVAGIVVMLAPALIRLVLSAIVAIANLFSATRVDVMGVFKANTWASGRYISGHWPFIVFGGILGVVLAWLRRRYGFRHRELVQHTYARRPKLPVPPDAAIAYLAGPIILALMAWWTDPRVYFKLLQANFLPWMISGVAAHIAWRRLQDWLLRPLGVPPRRLDYEYALRTLLLQDPMLATEWIQDVYVDQDGNARIEVVTQSDVVMKRVRDVARKMQDLRQIDVQATWPPPAQHDRPFLLAR